MKEQVYNLIEMVILRQSLYAILATSNKVYLRRGRPSIKTSDKQAFGPHTNTLGREIKSLIQMKDLS